ncbi:MAG: hypothetical protein V1870_03275 [Candidatus Aenigmatarchaeota archaeon]
MKNNLPLEYVAKWNCHNPLNYQTAEIMFHVDCTETNHGRVLVMTQTDSVAPGEVGDMVFSLLKDPYIFSLKVKCSDGEKSYRLQDMAGYAIRNLNDEEIGEHTDVFSEVLKCHPHSGILINIYNEENSAVCKLLLNEYLSLLNIELGKDFDRFKGHW